MAMLDEDSTYDLDRLVQSFLQGKNDLGEIGDDPSPLIFVSDEPTDELDLLAQQTLPGDEPSEDVEEEEEEEEEEERRSVRRLEGRSAEKFDDAKDFGREIFRYLQDRSRLLGQHYPFSATDSTLTLTARRISSSAYIYLLCCANLRFFPPKDRQTLTKSFELYSHHVLRTISPPGARVDCFGGAGGLKPSRFTGSNLYDRILALAAELRCGVTANASDFNPGDHGDNGLDLVAWVPLDGSRAEGVLSMFAQCACGEWEGTKQLEAHEVRWRRFLNMVSPPVAILFSPEMFRRLGGTWYSNADVATLVFDRMRCLVSYEEVPVDPDLPAILVALER